MSINNTICLCSLVHYYLSTILFFIYFNRYYTVVMIFTFINLKNVLVIIWIIITIDYNIIPHSVYFVLLISNLLTVDKYDQSNGYICLLLKMILR